MKQEPPFLCEYIYDGRRFSATIGGDSWEEAERHLKCIGANGRIVGSNVSSIPVNALTLPFAGIYVRLVVFFRNLLR